MAITHGIAPTTLKDHRLITLREVVEAVNKMHTGRVLLCTVVAAPLGPVLCPNHSAQLTALVEDTNGDRTLLNVLQVRGRPGVQVDALCPPPIGGHRGTCFWLCGPPHPNGDPVSDPPHHRAQPPTLLALTPPPQCLRVVTGSYSTSSLQP